MNRSILRSARALLLALGFLVTITSTLRSQIVVEVGGGAGTTRTWTYRYYVYNPLCDWSNTQRNRWLFRASDLSAAGVTPGQIVSIALNLRNSTPWIATRNVTIRMGSTPATNFGTVSWAWPNGETTVYNNPAYNVPLIGATSQWVTFNFQTPFMWDGTSNVMVDFCTRRNGNNYNFPEWEATTVSGANTVATTTHMNFYDFGAVDFCTTTPGSANRFTPFLRPVVRFEIQSGIESSFPSDVDPNRILRAGAIYDGTSPSFPKPSLSFRQTNGQNINLTYRLVGPLPSTNVIYEARRNGNPTMAHTATSTSLFTYEMTEATGPAAGPGGALDLRFAQGGAYRVDATYSIPGYTQTWQREFNIAFPNDLSVRTIRSPLAIPRKYPRGVSIPVGATIQNVGLNNVTDARVIASIYEQPSNMLVYRDTVMWTGDIATGAQASVDFDNFNTLAVSSFNITVCAELLNAQDQQAINDCAPQTGSYTFQTLYNEEVGAQAIDNPTPTGTYFARRPFTPRGRIINGGIQDLSNIPVRMQIYSLANGRTLVYNQLITVPDVGAEVPNNISSFAFPTFTPLTAGAYEACLSTEYAGDPVTTNNQICQQFTVQPNMSGVYTIGLLKQGDPRNYTTIQAAVDDLYRKGVSGAVEFELTDAAYAVGNTALGGAALDLTARIIGVDATNTITFKPSLARSTSKGSIVITLNSGNGQGILFGQSVLTTNPNSVQFEFQKDPQWANSGGNIRFDGGQQKSIAVELNATTPFRAPFYFGDGSQNFTVKNILIRNAPTASVSYATSLPTVSFVNNSFTYQPDVRTGPTTYSAGIVSRQKLPSGRDGNNSERLDTLIGLNNTFTGNEISGFGYGIVSIGIGVAVKSNLYRGYYSTGTQITDNLITNVRAAGVYLGYESGTVVRGNRIYSVGVQATGGTNVDAAGIMVGGVGRYNTTGVKLERNEISGVVGDLWTRGISVEQVRNTFPSVTAGGNTYFPQDAEATQVTNNVIWGLRRNSGTTNLAGIHLYTQRSTTTTGWTQLITPSQNNQTYFTRQDAVYNNTVLIPNDNIAGTGLVTALGIQHAGGATVKNNVFIMQGSASASTLSHSTVFYEGVQMTDGNDPLALVSDRNGYENGNAAMLRFVEINGTSAVISQGNADEFKFLSQWRAWTGRDINSVEGSLFAEMVYEGVAPNQRLRIKMNPAPIGSVLSNRGERLASVTTDIDGSPRGSAGQPYDLGADEFDGRQYIKDLEAVSVLEPNVYRSASGTTSDAEYVMTSRPVSITGLVRNSGALAQTNVPVRLRVYLETPASNNAGLATPMFQSTPVTERVINTAINSGAERSVVYDLTWEPQSYQQLAGLGYTVPARLASMVNNITPRYRVEISLAADDNVSNNITSKVVRYFVTRSTTKMLVSVRGGSVNLYQGTPTSDQIAGRLNGDSLLSALDRIGYYNDPINGTISYDVLDRDNFEERALDYSLYRVLFWGSDNDALTRFERRDLSAYVSSGAMGAKKNLAISGQNYPRQHIGLDVINDQAFIQSVLRVTSQAPHNPVPTSGTYSGRTVRGDAIARNTVETVTRTGFPGDAEPVPALVRLYSDPTTAGVVQRAYNYQVGNRETADSIMGSATASLISNTVYLGVDWRHWGTTTQPSGVERVVRGIFDFFETNGGGVVPVELMSFDAKARSGGVDVMWQTATEQNSDHFDVERADVLAGGEAVYTTVGTVAAAGSSATLRDYRFRDAGVDPGMYLYRLTAVDKDGARATSHAVQVELRPQVGNDGELKEPSVGPNPATTYASVQIPSATAGTASVEIVDMQGVRVGAIPSTSLVVGVVDVRLPIEGLANGAYTVIISANGVTTTRQLVIRR